MPVNRKYPLQQLMAACEYYVSEKGKMITFEYILIAGLNDQLEQVKPLAELGAYFSLPGYFAHERKTRQREAFRQVPSDRLLIETDAPDQLLPAERIRYPLTDPATGKAINHPANLGAVYRFASELLDKPVELLAERVEENFRRLFGALSSHRTL